MTKNAEQSKGNTNPKGVIKRKGYIIHPDFQKMFPEKSQEEYDALKELIRRDKVIRDPFVILGGNGILLDGHTRDKICEELQSEGIMLKPPIVKMSFRNDEEAKRWVIQNQYARRNLNTYQRIVFALQHEEKIAEKGKANLKTAGKSPSQDFVKVDTDKELAKLACTNHEMVRRVKRILEKATDADKEALEKEDVKINKIYKKYFPSSKKTKGEALPIAEFDNDVPPELPDTEGTELPVIPSPPPMVQTAYTPALAKRIRRSLDNLEKIVEGKGSTRGIVA